MIKAIISDFSRTLLFPKDTSYKGKLNDLYKIEKEKPDFRFFDYFVWNADLGDIYKAQANNLRLFIFTTENIQNDTALTNYISWAEKIINLKDIGGIPKNDPLAYAKLSEIINISLSEILFVDDSEENIIAAQKAGMQTIKYETVTSFKEKFSNLGKE